MDKRPVLMIVDSDSENRACLRRMLAEEYSLLEAASGDLALRLMADNEEVAAVILALYFPTVDGFALLGQMQREGILVRIPVIGGLLAGDEASELRALKFGVTDFAVPPYNEALIKLKIQNVLTRKAGAESRPVLPLAFSAHHDPADRDPLTGIYNRGAFAQKTEKLLLRNRDLTYVLLYFDIECFKVINALFGTASGDLVLRKAADCFMALAGRDGLCGRLEGDHFVACVPERSFLIEAALALLDESLAIFDKNYQLNFCLGIYKIIDRDLPVDQMCDRARLAANTIKGNYMQRYAVYDMEMRDKMLREQQILREMDFALRHGEFVIYLQPIYSVAEEKPISAEVLVRWVHPERGLISPGSFIPLFERNGFIVKLDAFIWEKACQLLAEMKESGRPVLPVSVNVSRLNFYNPSFCSFIIGLVRKYGLDPGMIKLEITESAYTDNPHYLLSGMETLQRAGFEILMDDFGSAYSSLNMLNDVPVDALKIDMKFVNALGYSAKAGNIMTSIIRMAKWLDMTVIAEGVETREQLDFLRSIGCPRVQGYYFSKPLPVEAFLEFMDQTEKVEAKAKHQIAAEFDFDAIWASSKVVNDLFNGLLSSMGIYELCSDSLLEVLRVNDDYYEMTGSTPQTIFSENPNVFSWIHQADREMLLHACRQAEAEQTIKQVYVRRYHQSGHLLWLEMKIRFLGRKEESSFFYFAANDVTEEIYRQQTNMCQQLLDTVLKEFGVKFWEIDIQQRSASVTASMGRFFGFSETRLANLPDSLLETGVVHMDSAAVLQAMFARIYEGRKVVSANLKARMPDGSYRWRWVKHIVFFDDSGKPYKAIGSFADKGILAQRVKGQVACPALHEGLLYDRDFRYEVDLTADVILAVERPILPQGPHPQDVYSEVIDPLADLYIHPEEQREFKKVMSPKSLLAAYKAGQRTINLDFLSRRNGADYHRSLTTIELVRNKASGHICAYGFVGFVEEKDPATGR